MPTWAVAILAAWLVAVVSVPAGATDDTSFGRQWNLRQIGAPAAWAVSSGTGVTIGIVDSGVNTGHPDLQERIDGVATCLGGTCREGVTPVRIGHGTAVAGIAAASGSNGIGIAGTAPGARLVVAEALDQDGIGRTGDINSAIRWVVDRGARVVNLSLGDADRDLANASETPLRTGIEYAWSRGAIPVIAAGNEEDSPGGVGSFNYGDLNAVVVGATDPDGSVSAYSSPFGNAKWGVVAPGGSAGQRDVGILTTSGDGGYEWVVGTSMAAPHVSGTLALLLAQGLGAQASVDRLLATADRSVPCGKGCHGRIRADAAVAPPPPAEPSTAVPLETVPPKYRAPDRGPSFERRSRGNGSPPLSPWAASLLLTAGGAVAACGFAGLGRREAKRNG